MTASGETIVVADVGNTRIKMAVVVDEPGRTAAWPAVTGRQDLISREFRPSNLQNWLDRVAPGSALILVASVHDAAAARLEAAVAEVSVTRHRPIRQRRVVREHLPLVVDVDEPSRVGIDRLAAAAAAAAAKAPDCPAIIVDCGTATTVDLVSIDGRFLGGAILPGPELHPDGDRRRHRLRDARGRVAARRRGGSGSRRPARGIFDGRLPWDRPRRAPGRDREPRPRPARHRSGRSNATIEVMTMPLTEPTTASADRAKELALAAARLAEEMRGIDVRVLDLRKITPVFDYFVIATGSSRRQMHAMADEIETVLKKELKDRKRGGEGYEEGRWIVLDYGNVMVHLFDAEAREYWDLEHLWSDAVPVPVPAAGAATR